MKEVVCTVVLEITKLDLKGPNNQDVIRIVQWNGGRPQLEKRSFWKPDEQSDFNPGKAKGFSQDDFKKLMKSQTKIAKALQPAGAPRAKAAKKVVKKGRSK